MQNATYASEHREFETIAVAEMVAEKVVTMLPLGEKPWVVSPLGVVPKKGTDKFRLTVNMRYVNGHLGGKSFKFEGLKDLSDLAERRDPRGNIPTSGRRIPRGLPSLSDPIDLKALQI